ncbi:MAG: PQQ-dependent sugar dehydrogenase, partial [Acidimicrobiia bacterium]
LLALVVAVAACSGDEDPEELPPRSSAPIGPGTTAIPPIGASSATTTTMPAKPLIGLDLRTVVRRLSNPVLVTAAPDDARLFIVEKQGVIRVVEDGQLTDEPFLDIRDAVGSEGLEQGLLGLAFHPSYADNGRFFIYYTDTDGDSRLVEFAASAAGNVADPHSGRLLLALEQPASNHNAGMLQFGPDGYLYVSLGDGGGANNQFGNAQRADTLLGTIIRIDVDAAEPYAIPPDNPFVAGGGAPEVWAYGLRNPWRFSIDTVDGLMYIADVGQDEWEEIDVVPLTTAGFNFGWSILEGSECFDTEPCSTEGLVPPVVTINHGEGCSVIGGFAYRGHAIPEMAGHYFYGDWCGRWIRSFRLVDGKVTASRDWTGEFGEVGQILSFGVDAAGELYVTTMEGFVFQIIPVR